MIDKTTNCFIHFPDTFLHSHWYEERPNVLELELKSLEEFKGTYNHPLFDYYPTITDDGTLSVAIRLPIKITSSPWEVWILDMRFLDNHALYKQENDGLFGGSIRIYPDSRHKLAGDGSFEVPIIKTYHHFVRENGNPNGPYYMCQLESAEDYEINARRALDQAIRWIANYITWESTGIDVDGEFARSSSGGGFI